MGERFFCAQAAAARDEPVWATASNVRRWLLIEAAGPWGREAVRQSVLPDGFADRLLARTRPRRIRVLVIRRHGRYTPDGVTVLAAATGRPGHVRRFRFERPEHALDIDLDALARGAPAGGQRVTDPVYLVCTNGRHDVCCAVYGRPLAAALAAARPEATWEVSHIGGDRFAGNVLCLPGGVYLGRVPPEDAVAAVTAMEAGRLPLAYYRGQAGWSFAVQAAEYLLRVREGLDAVAALRLQGARSLGDGRTRVAFAVADGSRLVAEVETLAAPEAALLTCAARVPAHPPRYRLVGVSRGAVSGHGVDRGLAGQGRAPDVEVNPDAAGVDGADRRT